MNTSKNRFASADPVDKARAQAGMVGAPMALREPMDVQAAHDITRGEHTVVKTGSPGRILHSHRSWFETTYTVTFTEIGPSQRGAITLIGLNKDDVQPRSALSGADI